LSAIVDPGGYGMNISLDAEPYRAICSIFRHDKAGNFSNRERERTRQYMCNFSNLMTRQNLSLIEAERAYQNRSIFQTDIRYVRKPVASDWLDLETLYALKKGNCIDLACALCAEINFNQLKPSARALWTMKLWAYPWLTWEPPFGIDDYHLCVWVPNTGSLPTRFKPASPNEIGRPTMYPATDGGIIIDPSRALGMV
jgi:hypothetical protein